MQLRSADPDLRTLVKRIEDGELDLQPEFQRGEVWSELKKQRLIDSILRDWQVPPVHIVIDPETDKQFVLDGQQRLAAIREFTAGKFRVNGAIEPADIRICELDGLAYSQLPIELKRKFDRYSIRVFYIYDYSPEEPGELFFRLNQNSALTPAEQRNAFFGGARRQVKSLIERLESEDLKKYYFGFSNARMAYDDIVARALIILESGTLRKKVTSSVLVDKYRSAVGFSNDAVDWLESGIDLFSDGKAHLYTQVRLNKATALSWMIFASVAARHFGIPANAFANLICDFEITRKRTIRPDSLDLAMLNPEWSNEALRVYDDRSTARVGDVSSVVLRDFVIWLHCFDRIELKHRSEIKDQIYFARNLIDSGKDLQRVAEIVNWGDSL